MQCPTCGTSNAPHALHCVKCGARLADAEPGFRDDSLVAVAATPVAGVTGARSGVGGIDSSDMSSAGVSSPSSPSASTSTSSPSVASPERPTRQERRDRRDRRERGEPNWLTSALVIGTAVFAAIALLGIWWNLRAPYVDPVPKPPGGVAVTPFNSSYDAPPMGAQSDGAAASDNAGSAASASLARAQAVAAADAAASGAAAEVAAANQSVPLSASAATAALTAAATALPPAATRNASPDEMMQLLGGRNSNTGTGSKATSPGANADLPAHYDGNDIDALAANGATQQAGGMSVAPAASAPSAASTIAAALAQCERYRWFEVIPKQRCIWAVCNGRWGKDGCPAGVNPGEVR